MPPRWAVVGAVLLGGLGAVTGLVVGLVVHAPTAWAATLEVGVPAACWVGCSGWPPARVTLAARAVRARRRSAQVLLPRAGDGQRDARGLDVDEQHLAVGGERRAGELGVLRRRRRCRCSAGCGRSRTSGRPAPS